jgi:hypothetical protein
MMLAGVLRSVRATVKATAQRRGVVGDESNRVFRDDGRRSGRRVGLRRERIRK